MGQLIPRVRRGHRSGGRCLNPEGALGTHQEVKIESAAGSFPASTRDRFGTSGRWVMFSNTRGVAFACSLELSSLLVAWRSGEVFEVIDKSQQPSLWSHVLTEPWPGSGNQQSG